MPFALKSSYFWTAAGGHERLSHANLLIVRKLFIYGRVFVDVRWAKKRIGERVFVTHIKSILILILKIVCIGARKKEKRSKENGIL